MNRRTSFIVVGLLAAALIGVALLAVPGSPVKQSPTLGLDLQGGLEVTLQAVPPPDRELTDEDLSRSVDIMRNRVDKLGVTEPEIRTQGSDQIVIQLPGVKDPAAAAEIIGTTAQLELYDLETSLTGPSISIQRFPVENPSLYDLLSRVQAQVEGKSDAYYLVNSKTKRVTGGPFGSRAEALRKSDGKLPAGRELFAVPQGMVVITCGPPAVVCPGGPQGGGVPPDRTYYYLFIYDPPDIPQMTGEDLKLSGTRADFDTSPGGGGRPIVSMEFTGKGGDRFEEITRAEWVRGKLRGTPQHFAIVLDREIRTWPQIDFTDSSLSGGIGGGRAQITGLDSIDEAQDIAIVLQTGALPVKFETLDRTDISATLGKDSLQQAWRAAIGGIVLVAFFLLLFYRFLGLVAVTGLVVYAAFLYATILIFNVTLTLPGFAGLVLTFGVAADANIVIFERIKEEARAGKSVRAAIANGYAKGFRTIIDANVVTGITAVILFVLATSGVRGFAFMLLLGTALSIVTAVFATRAFLALLGNARWFDNPALMGASAREIPAWQRIDFVGKRRIWFTIVGILITLSIGSLIFRGLNLGIDFRGGTEITFTTSQPTPLTAVRDNAAQVGQGAAQIQGAGTVVGGDSYREFRIRTESLEQAEQTKLTTELKRNFPTEAVNVKNVSASFSSQILRSAIYAIIFSFLLITLYITLRFEWRFAVPILRTIVNDGLIALGIYSFSGREVTQATVAAFLTIIGYSIYDTIIVFDRVRENMVLMRRSTFAQIVNVSLWETIPRSLATTFITLLPVSTLYFFGGETLKDFAFAVLIGISISAFSTFFIAAPFLAVLKEMEPEYKRRKESAKHVEEESVGISLREAEDLAAAEPAPDLLPDVFEGDGEDDEGDREPVAPASASGVDSKRERRRQRRSSRPHGRSR